MSEGARAGSRDCGRKVHLAMVMADVRPKRCRGNLSELLQSRTVSDAGLPDIAAGVLLLRRNVTSGASLNRLCVCRCRIVPALNICVEST